MLINIAQKNIKMMYSLSFVHIYLWCFRTTTMKHRDQWSGGSKVWKSLKRMCKNLFFCDVFCFFFMALKCNLYIKKNIEWYFEQKRVFGYNFKN